MSGHTGKLRALNEALHELPRRQEQQVDEWLRLATVEGARMNHSQQLADEYSAVAEVDRIETVLNGSMTRKYRWRLRIKNVDIEKLSPSALLVAILREVDEVINDAH